MDNQQERLRRLSWAAGLFDGEGSVILSINDQGKPNSSRWKGVRPIIALYNNDLRIIQRFCDVLTENQIPFCRAEVHRKSREYNRQRQFVVKIHGLKRTKRFCWGIADHVVGKAPQLVLLSYFIGWRESNPKRKIDDHDYHIVRALRWLNNSPAAKSSETNTPDVLYHAAFNATEEGCRDCTKIESEPQTKVWGAESVSE